MILNVAHGPDLYGLGLLTGQGGVCYYVMRAWLEYHEVDVPWFSGRFTGQDLRPAGLLASITGWVPGESGGIRDVLIWEVIVGSFHV